MFASTILIHSHTPFQVAGELVSEDRNKELEANAKNALIFFISGFRQTVESHRSIREVSMALKGYGYFAAGMNTILPEKELGRLFAEVTETTAHFMRRDDNTYESLSYFIEFLNALTKILSHLSVGKQHLEKVEDLAIFMVQRFPHLDDKYTPSLVSAIDRFCGLLANMCPLLLDDLVYQWLVYTCSVQWAAMPGRQTDFAAVSGQRRVSYVQFVPFWRHFLTGSEGERAMVQMKFDAFVKAVMAMCEKLDIANLEVGLRVARVVYIFGSC